MLVEQKTKEKKRKKNKGKGVEVLAFRRFFLPFSLFHKLQQQLSVCSSSENVHINKPFLFAFRLTLTF